MVILDITVLNVALPSIGPALGFAAADLEWVVTIYVLFTGGLLLGGRLADRSIAGWSSSSVCLPSPPARSPVGWRPRRAR
jgi:MFS family permease